MGLGALLTTVFFGIPRYSNKYNAIAEELFNNYYSFGNNVDDYLNSSSASSTHSASRSNNLNVKQCSLEQKQKVMRQLTPHRCIASRKSPWNRRCSFSKATSCPNDTWLSSYYRDTRLGLVEDMSANSSHFIGISVGCNKAFDAVNTLRMGTFDDRIDKRKWRNEIQTNDMEDGVCYQAASGQFDLQDSMKAKKRSGEMHCIEPLPINYEALTRSSQTLNYDQYGFIVNQYAISNQNGKIMFSTGKGSSPGVENIGLDSCRRKSESNCEEVTVLTLDTYVEKHVKADGPIHTLSIDVEGYDFDVLLGATNTLSRVEYLEFEYNWMGSWKNHHLENAVELLDGHGMICYWSGMDKLWRITGCWLEYFDAHYWSNVACVKKTNTVLADRMEDMFLRTLENESISYGGGLSYDALHNIENEMDGDPMLLIKHNDGQYKIHTKKTGEIYLSQSR